MFLPRSVKIQNKPTVQRVNVKSDRKEESCSSEETNLSQSSNAVALRSKVKDESSSEDEEVVISYSKHQRLPQPGEPQCVVCGRYGAYIVDRTDKDVCSLECKARHLARLGIILTPQTTTAGPHPVTNHAQETVGKRKELGRWRYREHPQVVAMTAAQVDSRRREMRVKVDGNSVPKLVLEFEQLCLPEKLMSNLLNAGYTSLTPVQMQVIPVALYQRNLLVCAATGTGKTLSFLLPIILHLMQGQKKEGVRTSDSNQSPRCLILVPTRELAIQIEDQAKQLMKGLPQMKTALVVGGVPIANQLHRLRSRVELVVATPARLNDMIENHFEDIELGEVELFVLDEVDCLLNMGFESQVAMIEEVLPARRQNLMFSATIPPRIERLAKEMMTEPIVVTVGEPGTPCEAIQHVVLWVEETAKKKKLLAFLRDEKHFNPPAVIFVSSKKGSLLLADTINKSSIPAATAVGLHGDITQDRRSEIVREFLEGKHSVLVATNVLARGIDLLNVRQVFVFDMSSSLVDFIHQVGRAGRMGSPGKAVTFINNSNKAIFLSFCDLFGRMGISLPVQLTSSPYLVLQRERRKRENFRTGPSPKRKRIEK